MNTGKYTNEYRKIRNFIIVIFKNVRNQILVNKLANMLDPRINQ